MGRNNELFTSYIASTGGPTPLTTITACGHNYTRHRAKRKRLLALCNQTIFVAKFGTVQRNPSVLQSPYILYAKSCSSAKGKFCFRAKRILYTSRNRIINWCINAINVGDCVDVNKVSLFVCLQDFCCDGRSYPTTRHRLQDKCSRPAGFFRLDGESDHH